MRDQVVKLLKAQTTGFSEEELYKALFGFYSKETGGSPVRLTLPFAFPPEALELIKKDTAFLYGIKSISTSQLADDAVLTDATEAILKERNLKIPAGVVKAATQRPRNNAVAAKTGAARSTRRRRRRDPPRPSHRIPRPAQNGRPTKARARPPPLS